MKHALLSALILVSITAHASPKPLKRIQVTEYIQTLQDQDDCIEMLESSYGSRATLVDSARETFTIVQYCSEVGQ